MRSLLPLLGLALGAGCAVEPAESPPDASSVDLNPNAEAVSAPGILIVDLQDETSLDAARTSLGLNLQWVDPRTADEALAFAEVDDVAAAQAAVAGNPLVEAAEPSLPMEAFESSTAWPDDPLFSKQWNFEKVGADQGWRAGGGQGVVVAVIDTGVTQVADLKQTDILAGASFVKGVSSPADDNGHGTHVAGTIAQSTNNALGVTGLAPNAQILPIKVLSGQGYGRSEWVAAGIDEAVDRGADVINMSLGGSNSRVIQTAVKKALAKGVIVVAAAGNSGRQGVSCPANVPGVIAVSATGPDDTLAFYSTWGKEVVLSAPGGDKRKTGGGILQDTIASGGSHEFKEFQGTSMATPHVAGAAAVLLGAGARGPDQVQDILTKSALDLGDPGRDAKYGYGRLDVKAAVKGLAMANGRMFALGAAAAFLLGGVARMRRGRVQMALLAGLTAGGLFFLPLLPLGGAPRPELAVLARPLLAWADWSNPLWLSALAPAALTFLLAPIRSLAPWIAGISAGVGCYLLVGALGGGLSVGWLPTSLGGLWLGANGVVALLSSLAGIGLLNFQERKRAGEG